MKHLILWVLVILGLGACQSQDEAFTASKISSPSAENSGTTDFPNTLKGATDLVLQFMDPNIDKAALSKKLRPNGKDYKSVFKGKAAKKAYEGYLAPWDEGKIVVRAKPGQEKVLLWSATTEELQKGTGDAPAFPGGYQKVAPHLKPGLTFYRFKFVRPGQELGFAWDGLVFVNGHWVIFPKPWRVLR